MSSLSALTRFIRFVYTYFAVRLLLLFHWGILAKIWSTSLGRRRFSSLTLTHNSYMSYQSIHFKHQPHIHQFFWWFDMKPATTIAYSLIYIYHRVKWGRIISRKFGDRLWLCVLLLAWDSSLMWRELWIVAVQSDQLSQVYRRVVWLWYPKKTKVAPSDWINVEIKAHKAILVNTISEAIYSGNYSCQWGFVWYIAVLFKIRDKVGVSC